MSQRPFSCFGEYNQRSNASQRSSLGYGSMPSSQPPPQHKETMRNEVSVKELHGTKVLNSRQRLMRGTWRTHEWCEQMTMKRLNVVLAKFRRKSTHLYKILKRFLNYGTVKFLTGSKQLTENVDKTLSTVNELEKAFDTKVTQLNDRCSQISDALETITELIKQQQTKETRSQECQTEKGT